ncbi:MAG: chromosomal replication initiator protein DnaA [Clostridia bacterium]|nr:chromosomal replication initiator protein DnaA [Clostridia bacterium]
MESYDILWKTALPEIEKNVSAVSYSYHICNLFPVDVIGNRLVLCTKAKILASQITDTLKDKILSAVKTVNEEISEIAIVVANDREEYLSLYESEQASKVAPKGSVINPKFTFDNFVVGASNQFICAAAKAVAERPGDSYNPLFIYGGTGLGKTHMLMAIANYIKLHKPSLNVLYATCEQFTNQMVESLSKGNFTPQKFRDIYRNVDVLLIDDVQFLAKKQATQIEFFHTFNELVMQNKQIVLTSDRPPKEIELLEERLRTRFEGGLLADVQPPDLETRIAILRRKAEEQKCIVDIKVLTYIAEFNDEDIRSLMGKLTKVLFFSKLREAPITIELTKEALKESANGNKEELEIDDIISCVCNFYKISKQDLLGKKKNKEFVEPRQICIYLITDMMNVPLATIGQKMGGRDHTTVIYARDKVSDLMKTDKKTATAINDIKKMLLKQ